MLEGNFWPPAGAFLDLSSVSQVTGGEARCTGVAVCDEEGRATGTFQRGQWAHFFYEFEVLKEIEMPMVALECEEEGGRVFQILRPRQSRRDAREGVLLGSVLPATWLYYHHIVHVRVGPGRYFFTVRLSTSETGKPGPASIGDEGAQLAHEYCRAIRAASFTVVRAQEQVEEASQAAHQRPQPALRPESRGQVLLAQLEEKQQVIYDLHTTAEERLQCIERLNGEMRALRARLEEQQQVIDDLHTAANEGRQGTG